MTEGSVKSVQKYRRISNKKQFYELYFAGALGNRLRIWRTLNHALVASPKAWRYGLRVSRAGGIFVPLVPYQGLVRETYRLVDKGYGQHEIIYHEHAPDHRLTLQGEVMEVPGGLYLAYNTKPGIMHREGMQIAKTVRGLAATQILRDFLNISSYSDLQAIFELYPGHVVEFSAYNHCLGCIPGRNAIIWEVRDY